MSRPSRRPRCRDSAGRPAGAIGCQRVQCRCPFCVAVCRWLWSYWPASALLPLECSLYVAVQHGAAVSSFGFAGEGSFATRNLAMGSCSRRRATGSGWICYGCVWSPSPVPQLAFAGQGDSTVVFLHERRIDFYRQACQRCGNLVLPKPDFVPGQMTFLSCCCVACMGGFCGCCCIPFCVDDLKDIRLSCPDCGEVLDTWRREVT